MRVVTRHTAVTYDDVLAARLWHPLPLHQRALQSLLVHV